MICPRITKCGHIYCWPCILHYLDYESKRNWKKCPLCSDPIKSGDLKNVKIKTDNYFKDGQEITFDLMVRQKVNCLVKNKYQESLILQKVAEIDE